MPGNPENLRRAATAKSAAARSRAEHGLQNMIRDGQPITFRGLAKTAGVSLDYLYSTTDIRNRVEQLRAQQQKTPPAGADVASADEPSSVVRTLTAQLCELKRRHRTELHQLQQALEAAHGENLQLRRQLGSRRPSRPDTAGDSKSKDGQE